MADEVSRSVFDDVVLTLQASAECLAEIINLGLAVQLRLFPLVLNLLLRLILRRIATRTASDQTDTGADSGAFTGITGNGPDQRASGGAANSPARPGTGSYLAGLLLCRLGLLCVRGLLFLGIERIGATGVDRPLVTRCFVG